MTTTDPIHSEPHQTDTSRPIGDQSTDGAIVYVSPVISFAKASQEIRQRMKDGLNRSLDDFLFMVEKNLGPKFSCFWQLHDEQWTPMALYPSGVVGTEKQESLLTFLGSTLDRTLAEDRTVAFLSLRVARETVSELDWPRDTPSKSLQEPQTNCHVLSAPIYLDEHRIGAITCLFDEATPSLHYRTDLMSVLAGMKRASTKESSGGHATADAQSIAQALSTGSSDYENLLLRCAASANYPELAFTIVNELRDLLRCDRVTLVDRRGDRFRVMAVSGQPTFDKRSSTIRQMERLSRVSARSERSYWSTSDELPPQIAEPISQYITETRCRAVATIPLFHSRLHPNPTDQQKLSELVNEANIRDKKNIGVLLLETMDSMPDESHIESILQRVMGGLTDFIATSKQHYNLIGMPIWLQLTWLTELFTGRTKRKAIAIMTAAILVLAALFMIPGEMRIRCEGVLNPRDVSLVFPRAESIIEKILVRDGERVQQGQVLVRLQCVAMRTELYEAESELIEVEERFHRLMRKLSFEDIESDSEDSSGIEESEHIDLATAREQMKPLRARVEVLAAELAKVETITSPIEGTVYAWNIEQRLTGRPVNPGERLFNIAADGSPLVLELEADNYRYGYVTRAQREAKQQSRTLVVDYQLASDSSRQWNANIYEVAPATDLNSAEDAILPIKALPVDSTEELLAAGAKPGTSVTAMIHCGRAPLIQCKLYSFFDWFKFSWFRYVG